MSGRWAYFKFRIAIGLVVLFVAGAVITFGGIRDTASLSKDVPDINEMLAGDFESNMFVQGQVWYCEGNFAYEYEESDYSSEEEVLREFYFIPLEQEWENDNCKYIVISASNQEQIDALSRLIDQTIDYFYNDVPDEEIAWEDIYYIGQVKPLQDDTADFLYEYLQAGNYLETGTRDEFDSVVVPYEIMYKEPSTVQGSLYAGIFMMAIPIIVGAVILGVYMKKRQNNVGFYPQAQNFTNMNNQPNSFNQNQSFGESSFGQQNPYQQQNPQNPYMQQNTPNNTYYQQPAPTANTNPYQQNNMQPMNINPYQQQSINSQNNTVPPQPDNKPAEMEELSTDGIDTSDMKF